MPTYRQVEVRLRPFSIHRGISRSVPSKPRRRPLPDTGPARTILLASRWVAMTRNPKVVAKKIRRPRMKLLLLDIDQSKAAVLTSPRSPESQRGCRLRITEPKTCRGHIACKRRQETRCSARQLACRWGSSPPLAIPRNRNVER